ncbi:enoyl-CoA hydratase-related protein [Rubrobacter aplysinae]|uniref:enoyl-CoA hydratase-related protein n=1 Tax=Rubrobacter aplysinae TaxID=909625 RepID=UPI00064C2559|nr:enoyl-CoA hydratase-related protein [Rubrobacter aplysinae]
MTDYEHLEASVEGGVATVTLDRPDVRNALSAGLIEELTRCMGEMSELEDVRVVVLTGRGESFCAGADIGYMRQTAGFSYEENLGDARRLAALFETIAACPKPVVACVMGAAIGGGVGLVAAADVGVAEEGCVFAFSEVRLGITPATIAPFVLRKIGHSHARSLFLTGERFGAERAREIGLVHEVAPGEELDELVRKKAGQLVSGGPEALASTKRLLGELEEAGPQEAAGITAARIAELRTGEEGQEGLTAFLEKRKPRWSSER